MIGTRCERGAEIARMLELPGADRGGDPRARRALGRQRPPARAAGRGDPAAGPHPVPGADRRGVRAHDGLPRRLRDGAQAPRPLVRPGAGRRACSASATTPSSGGRSRTRARCRPSAAGSRATGCCTPTRRRSTTWRRRSARVIDAKSPFTARHSAGVAAYAVAIAGAMGMDANAQRDLRRAGLLHDIGKLGGLLAHPRQAGQAHRRGVHGDKAHPAFTLRILERVACFRPLARMAAAHHERLDGSGYHLGLAAFDLSRSARILAVADVFEALTADRPYREAMPIEKALGIVREHGGTALCPAAVARPRGVAGRRAGVRRPLAVYASLSHEGVRPAVRRPARAGGRPAHRGRAAGRRAGRRPAGRDGLDARRRARARAVRGGDQPRVRAGLGRGARRGRDRADPARQRRRRAGARRVRVTERAARRRRRCRPPCATRAPARSWSSRA